MTYARFIEKLTPRLESFTQYFKTAINHILFTQICLKILFIKNFIFFLPCISSFTVEKNPNRK